MIRVCAWCKSYLGGAGDSADGVSHGVCDLCKAVLMADSPEGLPREEVNAMPEMPGHLWKMMQDRDPDPEPDGDPVRGLLIGLAISVPVWIAAAVTLWRLTA